MLKALPLSKRHCLAGKQDRELIVDLAGSERVDEAGSEGHTLEEAKLQADTASSRFIWRNCKDITHYNNWPLTSTSRRNNQHHFVWQKDFGDYVELILELKRLKLRKNNWDIGTFQLDEVLIETASQKRTYCIPYAILRCGATGVRGDCWLQAGSETALGAGQFVGIRRHEGAQAEQCELPQLVVGGVTAAILQIHRSGAARIADCAVNSTVTVHGCKQNDVTWYLHTKIVRVVVTNLHNMVNFKGSKAANGGYIALEDGTFGGMFDKPLRCFGCGIGWLLFLVGIIFPIAWFAGTILYLIGYSRSDPRERAGLGACAAAALICTFVGVIVVLVVTLKG
ncbi:hypothetical protein L7F22_028082 [Adiantum nelumboides]|nr:hypothetical protein [Adiantum nelumboides]